MGDSAPKCFEAKTLVDDRGRHGALTIRLREVATLGQAHGQGLEVAGCDGREIRKRLVAKFRIGDALQRDSHRPGSQGRERLRQACSHHVRFGSKFLEESVEEA